MRGPDPAGSPAVALTALILLCVLTGIALFLVVRLMLAAPVAAAEDVNAPDILRRSFHLTRGNWWRLFAFVFLYGLGAAVLLSAIQWVLGPVAETLLGGVGQLTIGGLIVTLAVELVSAAASVTFFVVLARIYVQLSGRDSIAVSVPRSGT